MKMSTLAAILAATCLAAEPSSAACRTTPVIDADFPDPEILRVGQAYYAYATNTAGQKVQVAQSTDLENWTMRKDALPQLPRWAVAGRTWAPAVAQIDGRFVLYFTARNGTTDVQCIGTAISDKPEGPFQAAEAPLVCPADLGGAIDAAFFRDVDGMLYLLWKNDGNSRGRDTSLFLQKLAPDGLSFTGDRVELIKQDLSWEGTLVEAPTLILHNGRYHLFYSANAFGDERYAVGHAVAARVGGPYTKDPRPFLASGDAGGRKLVGPGGQAIFEDAGGNGFVAFHAWSPDRRYRAMHIAPLDWWDGRPSLRLDCASAPPSPSSGAPRPTGQSATGRPS